MAKKVEKRALTVRNIENYTPVVMNFTDRWLDSFGCPELRGSWIIWGESGNGKTRFALQLAKYLCQFGKVIYNSLEEGLSESIKMAIAEVGMKDVSSRFSFLDMESLEEMEARLEKRRSANIVFVDSVQYLRLTQRDYIRWKKKFPTKLFVFVSHAKNGEPKGAMAQSIRYDAFIKMNVSGYKVLPVSRYGGSEPFVVWEHGAQLCWGSIDSVDNV